MKRIFHVVALTTLLTIAGQAIRAQDYDKGYRAYTSGDYATALREWRPLAEQGDSDAQYNLGVMYKYGRGVTEDDAEAVKWYRKAAEQGYTHAQFNLGGMYFNGEGVTQDYAEAVKWGHKAAEQGYAKAQTSLGMMYFSGKGVIQDNVYAHMWFNIAASLGDDDAPKYRDRVAGEMTSEDISQAQKLAR
ncbi:tetratricopeptide repeat protein [Sulfitobacter sp.]|uniref:tetratricopeptide repeat protein n=1 Tax=Sulfitobacter sp. TaxID=1903071 RepID=UPI0030013CAD